MADKNPLQEPRVPGVADVPSPDSPHDDFPEEGLFTRFIIWAADLPWWAIILIIVIVGVIYSMSTSIAYQQAARQLTDDPQVTTDDLFEVVQVVGEPTMITGRIVGETADSVYTVINALLESSIESELVTHSGFLVRETEATLTIQDGDKTIRIAKDRIVPDTETRTETDDGIMVELTYIDRVTVTGTLVKQTDDTMRIRTVNEATETFDADRVISRETVEVIACDRAADPDCEDRARVTFQREGAVITGELSTLSNVNLSLDLGEGQSAEYRRSNLEYLRVPTLTVAVNEAANRRDIGPGDEVRVAFPEGTDITEALEQLESLDNVPVPLRFANGQALVVLVPYPDPIAAVEATAAGEVDGLVYLSDGPDRLAVAEWVEANPEAGVSVPDGLRECDKGCTVTLKLEDDEVTGIVLRETDDEIKLQLVPPEYVEIDRDLILENRRKQPGVCAWNNPAGCDEGIFLTLRVTFQAYALALLIGLIVGLMRIQTNPTTIFSKLVNTVVKTFSTLYVEVVRGIPLLVILVYAGFVVAPQLRKHPLHWPDYLEPVRFLINVLIFAINQPLALWNMINPIDFIDLGHLGDVDDPTVINLAPTQQAVVGLAFGYGAFIAEIFRAGIQSIGRGQMEAARSLGMSYPQAMRYVILPQAIRVVLPPLGNDFIALLKDSALISVLALPDLLQQGRLYVSRTFRAFEGYNTVAILYLMMTLFLSMMVRVIERRTRLPE